MINAQTQVILPQSKHPTPMDHFTSPSINPAFKRQDLPLSFDSHKSFYSFRVLETYSKPSSNIKIVMLSTNLSESNTSNHLVPTYYIETSVRFMVFVCASRPFISCLSIPESAIQAYKSLFSRTQNDSHGHIPKSGRYVQAVIEWHAQSRSHFHLYQTDLQISSPSCLQCMLQFALSPQPRASISFWIDHCVRILPLYVS